MGDPSPFQSPFQQLAAHEVSSDSDQDSGSCSRQGSPRTGKPERVVGFSPFGDATEASPGEQWSPNSVLQQEQQQEQQKRTLSAEQRDRPSMSRQGSLAEALHHQQQLSQLQQQALPALGAKLSIKTTKAAVGGRPGGGLQLQRARTAHLPAPAAAPGAAAAAAQEPAQRSASGLLLQLPPAEALLQLGPHAGGGTEGGLQRSAVLSMARQHSANMQIPSRLQKAATCPEEITDDLIAAAIEASQRSFAPSRQSLHRAGRPPSPSPASRGGFTPPQRRRTADAAPGLPRPSPSPTPHASAGNNGQPRRAVGFAALPAGAGGGGGGGAAGGGGDIGGGIGLQRSGSLQRWPGMERGSGASSGSGGLQRASSLQQPQHAQQLQRAGSTTTQQLFEAQADATTAQAQVACLSEALSKEREETERLRQELARVTLERNDLVASGAAEAAAAAAAAAEAAAVERAWPYAPARGGAQRVRLLRPLQAAAAAGAGQGGPGAKAGPRRPQAAGSGAGGQQAGPPLSRLHQVPSLQDTVPAAAGAAGTAGTAWPSEEARRDVLSGVFEFDGAAPGPGASGGSTDLSGGPQLEQLQHPRPGAALGTHAALPAPAPTPAPGTTQPAVAPLHRRAPGRGARPAPALAQQNAREDLAPRRDVLEGLLDFMMDGPAANGNTAGGSGGDGGGPGGATGAAPQLEPPQQKWPAPPEAAVPPAAGAAGHPLGGLASAFGAAQHQQSPGASNFTSPFGGFSPFTPGTRGPQ